MYFFMYGFAFFHKILLMNEQVIFTQSIFEEIIFMVIKN